VLSRMKLSAWAKKNGLTYKTAWRLLKEGKLPLPAEQLATLCARLYGKGAAKNRVDRAKKVL